MFGNAIDVNAYIWLFVVLLLSSSSSFAQAADVLIAVHPANLWVGRLEDDRAFVTRCPIMSVQRLIRRMGPTASKRNTSCSAQVVSSGLGSKCMQQECASYTMLR